MRSIASNSFSLPYSSGFLLSISTFILSVSLIYLILKSYFINISAYLTCLWFSFLVVKNPIKFL